MTKNVFPFKFLFYTLFLFLADASFAQFNPNLTYGEVIDIDGNIYKTIKIGNQTWMAENLNVYRFRNGDQIPEIKMTKEWEAAGKIEQPAYCYYENDVVNGTKYGKLYNWYAVVDSRNICPVKWHVPTDEEWSILIANLDPTSDPMTLGVQSYSASDMMRSTGTQYWRSPNSRATNSSGFSALPGAARFSEGNFLEIHFKNLVGYWWTSTEEGVSDAWYRHLDINGDVGRVNLNKSDGYSVRCIKD